MKKNLEKKVMKLNEMDKRTILTYAKALPEKNVYEKNVSMIQMSKIEEGTVKL